MCSFEACFNMCFEIIFWHSLSVSVFYVFIVRFIDANSPLKKRQHILYFSPFVYIFLALYFNITSLCLVWNKQLKSLHIYFTCKKLSTQIITNPKQLCFNSSCNWYDCNTGQKCVHHFRGTYHSGMENMKTNTCHY